MKIYTKDSKGEYLSNKTKLGEIQFYNPKNLIANEIQINKLIHDMVTPILEAKFTSSIPFKWEYGDAEITS